MHGLVVVDKNQEVLRPSIIWCDSRAVGIGNATFHGVGEAKCIKLINGEDISLSLSIDNWNFDRKSIIQKSNTKSITDRYIIDYNEEEFAGVTK